MQRRHQAVDEVSYTTATGETAQLQAESTLIPLEPNMRVTGTTEPTQWANPTTETDETQH